jgi:uncharacterized protein YdeI (YjbR/CyaY-like superfamily)
VKTEKRLTFTDRAAWRSWLVANHASSQTVWLVFFRTSTGSPSIDYESAIEEALCYGWIDSLIKSLDDQRYMRKFTRRTNVGKWSPSNIARMKSLIATGRMTPAGMAVIDPRLLSGASERAHNSHQESVFPQEYQGMLVANPKAMQFFNNLPPSQKRLTVGWVLSAVKPETRLRRMQEVVTRMAAGQRLGLK